MLFSGIGVTTSDSAIKRLKLVARNVFKIFFILDNPLSFNEYNYKGSGK